VAAGYVKTTNEAFANWLSRGRPGFIAREGASPERVFEQIHDAPPYMCTVDPGALSFGVHCHRFL